MEKMPFRDAQSVSDVQAVIAAARAEADDRQTGGSRCRC